MNDKKTGAVLITFSDNYDHQEAAFSLFNELYPEYNVLRSKTSTILKNSQYTFIFKLSAPDVKDLLDIYQAGDSFNGEEQRRIISAVTGQAFFIGSTELRNCVNIKAGKYVKSLFDERTAEQYEKEGN